MSTNKKLNPHMASTPRFQSGPHWREASALTTAPSLLPKAGMLIWHLFTHTIFIYFYLFIQYLYRVSILAEASLSRALIKIKGYTYITVKPDVLFRATLQTSAAMLVFLLAVCSERFATSSYNLLAKVANLLM